MSITSRLIQLEKIIITPDSEAEMMMPLNWADLKLLGNLARPDVNNREEKMNKIYSKYEGVKWVTMDEWRLQIDNEIVELKSKGLFYEY